MKYIKYYQLFEKLTDPDLLEIKEVIQDVIDEFDFDYVDHNEFGPTDQSNCVYTMKHLDYKKGDSYMRKEGYNFMIEFLYPSVESLESKFEKMMLDCRDHFNTLGYKTGRIPGLDEFHSYSGYNLYSLYL